MAAERVWTGNQSKRGASNWNWLEKIDYQVFSLIQTHFSSVKLVIDVSPISTWEIMSQLSGWFQSCCLLAHRKDPSYRLELCLSVCNCISLSEYFPMTGGFCLRISARYHMLTHRHTHKQQWATLSGPSPCFLIVCLFEACRFSFSRNSFKVELQFQFDGAEPVNVSQFRLCGDLQEYIKVQLKCLLTLLDHVQGPRVFL